MKYMLLAYTNQAEMSEVDVTSPEFLAMCRFYEELASELTASGELVLTDGLADGVRTTTIRKGHDGLEAVDGPFAEAKEVLVSFAILDCDSHDRVKAIAARIVEAVGDTVEIRPIMEQAPGADG